MKIVAVNDDATMVIESKHTWDLARDVNTGYMICKNVLKKQHPEFYKSLIAKWGFIPLTESIDINSVNDIDEEMVKKAMSSMQWQRDYIS